MVENTRSPLLLTEKSIFRKLSILPSRIICLDDPSTEEAIREFPSLNPDFSTRSDDLAYIIYTSGSTGTPKGVEVSHRAVIRLVRRNDYIPFHRRQTFLLLASPSFDASTLELWGSLLNGAKLAIYSGRIPEFNKLKESINRYGVTCLFLTTSLFNTIINEAPETLSNLSFLITGGEALSVKSVLRALKTLPKTRILNAYGPTENTTFTTTCSIPKDFPADSLSVPIGRPIANTQVYILDRDLNPVPIGVPGELHTGGAGLAKGYRNRPDLTLARFIYNPFGGDPEERLFKTGDFARYLPDGRIEFLGRLDHQVKIRGFRVELGEIEEGLGKECSIAVLFEAPTIVQLAEVLRGKKSTSSQEPIISLQNEGSGPPLFLIHFLYHYKDLAVHLGADQPIDRVYLPIVRELIKEGIILKRKGVFPKLETHAIRYVEVIRKKQPSGPYYLAGYSFGGQYPAIAAAQGVRFIDPTYGWGTLVSGGLEIYEIPGNHGTLLQEPNVRVLAKQLRSCLKDARRKRSRWKENR